MASIPSSSARPLASTKQPEAQQNAQSVLWAHLLRKDTPATGSSSAEMALPPLGPVDKNATSTRILLHDTQANLQKFSDRVEKMSQSIESTRREITTVKTLFQEEHETLVGEMVDLVNRCQSEIKRPIGIPAQAEKLEDFQKNIELRMEHLDKRLDAIQMFQTTHSQTLQTHNQLLLALKDQQTTIVAAVSPLLPLIQALPVQIESLRTTVNEAMNKALESIRTTSSSPKLSMEPVTPNAAIPPATLPLTSSSIGKKRRRTDENLFDLPLQAPSSAVTKTSVLTSLIGRKPSLVQRNPSTPRQPLADLIPSNNQAQLGPSNERRITPRTHAPSSSRQAPPVFLVPALPAASVTPVSIRTANKPSMPDFSSSTPHLQLAGPRTPSMHITTNARSSTPRPSTPQARLNATRKSPTVDQTDLAHRRPVVHPPTVGTSTPATHQPTGALNLLTRNPTMLQAPLSGGRPFTAAPLRQRRSPFREGRRFIPLGDSDDDDDDSDEQ
ncbi:hypothetical protein VNI00_000566 [Paramarasmius palmivorus]|uniref:Uncharacterized protein n=1 Tax=Paramarasmius palmivorus TaxID=297713 RepID=A0AAW0E899_9AGAR